MNARRLFWLGIFAVMLVSCKDEVLVQTTFQKKYSLNCILRGDTSFQVAVLTQSYPRPAENEVFAPYLKNAQVELSMGKFSVIMRDSSVARKDTQRYKDSVYFYYASNFSLIPQNVAKIKAVLEDGTVLSGETEIPRKVDYDGAKITRIIPPQIGDSIYIAWKPLESDLLYALKLKIIYFHYEGGEFKKKEMEVPLRYENGKAIYPRPGFDAEIRFPLNAFNETMNRISDGDPQKADYFILKARAVLVVYDRNLSAYYSATHFLDEYSLRLDELDFSNIDGGFGVFGSYLKIITDIAIDENYIVSYGYRVKR
jgi:hypothetical protein